MEKKTELSDRMYRSGYLTWNVVHVHIRTKSNLGNGTVCCGNINLSLMGNLETWSLNANTHHRHLLTCIPCDKILQHSFHKCNL
jgi:hypothetical protein